MRDPGREDAKRGRARLEAFFREDLRASEAEAPSYDDVAGYVDGTLDAGARDLFEQRLADDPLLRDEVRDLEEVRDALRAGRGRRLWQVAGLLAAAAALVIASLVLRPSREVAPTSARAVPAASPSPATAWTLRDGSSVLALDATGALAGLEEVDPVLRRAVAEALQTGEVPVPAELQVLRGTRGTLMAPSAEGTAFAVSSPLGTVVRSARPSFRWRPHPAARSYVVSVFDEALNRVTGSAAVRGTEWTATLPLPRGRTYLWQVVATTPAGPQVAPAPPEPEARFRVIGETEAAELERALQGAQASPLARGVAMARAGVVDEAEQLIAEVAAANPDVPVARELLSGIREAAWGGSAGALSGARK
jgi:hypothetical protein